MTMTGTPTPTIDLNGATVNVVVGEGRGGSFTLDFDGDDVSGAWVWTVVEGDTILDLTVNDDDADTGILVVSIPALTDPAPEPPVVELRNLPAGTVAQHYATLDGDPVCSGAWVVTQWG